MNYDLEKTIEDFSEEIFADLGLASLTEDDKADVYARVQARLHHVILRELAQVAPSDSMGKIRGAMEQEDYHALDALLEQYPQYQETLQAKIDEELAKLKFTISEEQKHAGNGQP